MTLQQRSLPALALCAAALLPACPNSVDSSRADGARADGSAAETTPPDATAPGDAPPELDATAPPDATRPPPDGAPPPDTIVVPPDGSLQGAWRMIRREAPDGGLPVVTDRNTPVTAMTGVTYDVRINGALFLTDRRLAITLAFLTNDQLALAPMVTDTATALPHYGYVAPGVLTGDTFVLPGGSPPTVFTRNADGTITIEDMGGRLRTTFARMPSAPLPGLPARYRAHAGLVTPASSAPVASPRVALAWDLPGPTAGYAYSNDAPVARFNPAGYTAWDIAIAAVPAGAQAMVGGVEVAVAYPILYDDTDGDARYTEGSDTLRGFSRIAFALRGAGDAAALAGTPLRDLLVGAQLARVNPDYATARQALTPFDPALPVAPDIAVNTSTEPGPLPDLLR